MGTSSLYAGGCVTIYESRTACSSRYSSVRWGKRRREDNYYELRCACETIENLDSKPARESVGDRRSERGFLAANLVDVVIDQQRTRLRITHH